MDVTPDPVTDDPLRSGLRAMRGQTVAVPRELARRVIADVRTYPPPGRDIPTEGASAKESDIATLIRATADTVDGVRARACRVKPCRDAKGTPIVGPLEVELSFAVSYGSSIPAVGEALIPKVSAALSSRYGLSVGRLHLKAVDLTPLAWTSPAHG